MTAVISPSTRTIPLWSDDSVVAFVIPDDGASEGSFGAELASAGVTILGVEASDDPCATDGKAACPLFSCGFDRFLAV